MHSTTPALLGYTIWVTIAWIVCMTLQLRAFDKSKARSSRGASPILPIELSATSGQFDDVLDQGDRRGNAHVVKLNTYMDFLFILLYSSIFWMLADVTGGRLLPWIRLAIVVTAALDIAENLAILSQVHRVLADSIGAGVSPYYPSIAKWAMFGVVLCLLGLSLFWTTAVPYHIPIAVLVLASGLTCLAGLCLHRLINISVFLLFPALILIGIVAMRK